MWTILGGAAVLFTGFAVLDIARPARALPQVSLWRTKGVASFIAYFTAAICGPLFWDSLIAQHTLFDASALPLWLQIIGGFFALELGVYLWHRTMHSADRLWRHIHQWHHSAERIDIWGAFWFHPLDMIGWALLGSLALVGGFGVSLEAGITISLIAAFCSMFQHANIRTPRWLGYLITRPESHALHHERGAHRYNYGDVPWFDILFGTFRNPEHAPEQAGFFDGALNRIGALLIGRKIS
ncbi:MAG: sterol desaturase family protein [Sphingomonadaceae bacterium]|nr:sterol desaturase family protein [Sphingomonadaceae bacterium]